MLCSSRSCTIPGAGRRSLEFLELVFRLGSTQAGCFGVSPSTQTKHEEPRATVPADCAAAPGVNSLTPCYPQRQNGLRTTSTEINCYKA
jgi:hypothetical protein